MKQSYDPLIKVEKKTEGSQKEKGTVITNGANQVDKRPFKFCLFNGNNSTVFRKILLARGNWEEVSFT